MRFPRRITLRGFLGTSAVLLLALVMTRLSPTAFRGQAQLGWSGCGGLPSCSAGQVPGCPNPAFPDKVCSNANVAFCAHFPGNIFIPPACVAGAAAGGTPSFVPGTPSCSGAAVICPPGQTVACPAGAYFAGGPPTASVPPCSVYGNSSFDWLKNGCNRLTVAECLAGSPPPGCYTINVPRSEYIGAPYCQEGPVTSSSSSSSAAPPPTSQSSTSQSSSPPNVACSGGANCLTTGFGNNTAGNQCPAASLPFCGIGKVPEQTGETCVVNGCIGNCVMPCNASSFSSSSSTTSSPLSSASSSSQDVVSVCGPVCGDGFLKAGLEECDDGNLQDGDGCSHDCLAESFVLSSASSSGGNSSSTPPSCSGFECALGAKLVCQSQNPPTACQQLTGGNCFACSGTCGNHALDPGETCDDGNMQDGDGCDHLCAIDSNYCAPGGSSSVASVPSGQGTSSGQSGGGTSSTGVSGGGSIQGLCVDSDDTVDNDSRLTKNTITFAGASYTDYCAGDPVAVAEYTCAGSPGNQSVQLMHLPCPWNTPCVNGACQIASCVDSDSANALGVAGTMTFGAQVMNDTCTDATHVVEWACVAQPSVPLHGVPQIGPTNWLAACPAGQSCINGACQ